MISPSLTKTFTAGAAVLARRIVKMGNTDLAVIQATGSTAAMLGVSDMVGDSASGDRVDVHLAGVVEVVLGGAVTRNDRLTSDANAAAVTAAPAAGVNAHVVGIALASGVSGDIIPVFLSNSVMQG